MENHYTVYKLTDPEGKIYIGCTGTSVEKRWRKGRGYRRGLPIREAILHYGWKNFQHEILCENLTKEEAEKLEKWFIDWYDSTDPAKGYNRFLGGLGKGAHMSEFTKKLSSEAKYRLYDEHPEIKEKIRQTVKAAFASDPDYRRRVGKGVLKAYEKDPNLRKRMSEKAERLWRDPTYRERTSAGRREVCVMNFDLAERTQASHKSYYNTHPKRREEISLQMRTYLSDPANRAFVVSDSRAKPVRCVETGVVYPSQRSAEKDTGFAGIHKACSGRQSTAGGYHWCYVSGQN